MSPIRVILLLAVVGIIGIGAFKWISGGGGLADIPKEALLTYVPADFRPEVNLEDALPTLANPERYAHEFDKLVHDFNLSLIRHVARRMGLSDSLQLLVERQYERYHPSIREMMYADFVAMTDSTSSLYASWYKSEFTNAVDVFREVATKYTCFFINQVLAAVLPSEEGKIYVKGEQADTPCGVAMREALQPMIERLKKQAAIEDFNRSKNILQERVEKAIAELATMEIRDRKGIAANKQTRFLGLDVSSSEMEMTAISIMKVGFKLDKHFEITLNERAGLVIVTLPEPEILSHEVYPRIDKLDIGWLREIDPEDFNKNMDLLRRAFRTEAQQSDVYDKAKQRAAELLDSMLTPVVKSLNPRFQVKVRFITVGGQEGEPAENKPLGDGMLR